MLKNISKGVIDVNGEDPGLHLVNYACDQNWTVQVSLINHI